MDKNKTIIRSTTVVCVRDDKSVVIASDGQVTLGTAVIKSNANKIRTFHNDQIIVGFAGSTADALTLFDRLEKKCEEFSYNLKRACVELAKDWRTDRYLRRLESMIIAADKNDWDNLSKDEKHFIEHILAFFAGSDGIVLENLLENFIF